MHIKYVLPVIIFAALYSCSNTQTKLNSIDSTATPLIAGDTSVAGFKVFDAVSAVIAGKHYVLTVYRNDSACFFIVQKQVGGQFKTIMKEPGYGTNNSTLLFKDENNDGYEDIVWTKKWQDHSYLFNPQIENFVEVGEFHTVDTLKVLDQPVVYHEKYPLLYYWNEEKAYGRAKCGEDTMFVENHSELFVIDDNYQKISFAVLDNSGTLDAKPGDSLQCGDEIIKCYVPPYYGKYGDNSIWNSGVTADSVLLIANKATYKNESYTMDSTFITNYWQTNYVKLLRYGQPFKVRREKPIEYYK
jgi:hypothetical protein